MIDVERKGLRTALSGACVEIIPQEDGTVRVKYKIDVECDDQQEAERLEDSIKKWMKTQEEESGESN